MRVRHLQTYLSDQGLVEQFKIEQLRGLQIGIDAVYWTRTLPGLKDPLAEALGSLPPSLYGLIDRELEHFHKFGIHPTFVFQGIQPRSHHLFQSQAIDQMDSAWSYIAEGNTAEGQNCFAQVTSRINTDFIQIIFNYLRAKGCTVFQAPYLATAQLAYFVEQKCFDAIVGPPSIMLFGVSRTIMQFDFPKKIFHSVDIDNLLTQWNVDHTQFVESCLLAGTEYCLTYPYLNLHQFHPGQSDFTFGAALDFIRQSPLSSYACHFPSEDTRIDHVERYCLTKTLLMYPIVMQLNGCVAAIPDISGGYKTPPSKCNALQRANGNSDTNHIILPDDITSIVGERLPHNLYFLMCRGVVSRKLLTALATGVWIDYSHPIVDSNEYRDILNDLVSYRLRAVGLLASHLDYFYQTKQIEFTRYCDSDGNSSRIFTPNCERGLRWKFTAADIEAECNRQQTKTINIRFCLSWIHAQSDNIVNTPVNPDQFSSEEVAIEDVKCLQAEVYLTLLDSLGFFTPDGGMTAFGVALKDVHPDFQEHCLFVLELMKFGLFTSDPLEPGYKSKNFPVKYPNRLDLTQSEKCILLLTRIMSLVSMKLKADYWNSDLSFDLAAYHCAVRVLKRSLRQLVEGATTRTLLRDVTKVNLLPANYANPRGEQLLPLFAPPRNSMGIVAKYIMECEVDEKPMKKDFQEHLKSKFPCCIAPLEDFSIALDLWNEVSQLINRIGEAGVDVSLATVDIEDATVLLQERLLSLGL
eukprot:GHVL01023775.1.p1 GENE.GHVL01023775.1~~GHVL01023775.1.p1  ORF type:complete len:749 (+),score=112.32 GHVL01023775.1:61-2307(+)